MAWIVICPKTKNTIMDKEKKTLAEVYIASPLGGYAIDPQGKERQDLIEYIKTLLVK